MSDSWENSKPNVKGFGQFSIVGDPVLLVQFLAKLMNDERIPKPAKLKLLGSGLYTWIDGDILADTISFVPGLGYFDDFILVVHGINVLISETDPDVALELWPGDESSFHRVLSAVSWLDKQLYGRIRSGLSRLLDSFMKETSQYSKDTL